MPWTGAEFRSRHNHGMSAGQADHAAAIANAMLRRDVPEGESIATANKLAHRDDGGEIGGPTPVETANPLTRNMVNRYSSMSPEKLQELAVMLRGSPQAGVIEQVLNQKRLMPQQAAQQPQQSAAGGGDIRRAAGGPSLLSPAQGAPWWTRTEAFQTNRPGVLLHGATGGRADAIKTTAPGGSHVIPADVVSGLGEGNTAAGAKVIEHAISSGPWGTAPHPMRAGRGIGIPHMRARGGETGTAVDLSDGEFLVYPHWVRHIGGGDHARGVRILNHFIRESRKHIIATMKKLPGPVREGEKNR